MDIGGSWPEDCFVLPPGAPGRHIHPALNGSDPSPQPMLNVGSSVTIHVRGFGRPRLTGTFMLSPGSRPGAVVVDIDFGDRANRSGRVSAEVREGWLKAMAAGRTTRSEAAAAVAAALTEIAAIPRQRTVQQVTYRRTA